MRGRCAWDGGSDGVAESAGDGGCAEDGRVGDVAMRKGRGKRAEQ